MTPTCFSWHAHWTVSLCCMPTPCTAISHLASSSNQLMHSCHLAWLCLQEAEARQAATEKALREQQQVAQELRQAAGLAAGELAAAKHSTQAAQARASACEREVSLLQEEVARQKQAFRVSCCLAPWGTTA